MLLSQVTALGGIGTEPNSDEAQEQLTLAVSITGACVGECKSTSPLNLVVQRGRRYGVTRKCADDQSLTKITPDWKLSGIYFE
jgi:hypothetical protein